MYVLNADASAPSVRPFPLHGRVLSHTDGYGLKRISTYSTLTPNRGPSNPRPRLLVRHPDLLTSQDPNPSPQTYQRAHPSSITTPTSSSPSPRAPHPRCTNSISARSQTPRRAVRSRGRPSRRRVSSRAVARASSWPRRVIISVGHFRMGVESVRSADGGSCSVDFFNVPSNPAGSTSMFVIHCTFFHRAFASGKTKILTRERTRRLLPA